MRKIVLSFLILSLYAACANVGRVADVIDPQKVAKPELSSLPVITTPKYIFRVSIVESLIDKRKYIIAEVDDQFSEFEECAKVSDGGKEARHNLISVVDGTFECEYHGGRCNGEYDSARNLIIVSYKAFNREGLLPLLKHEWAHAYGILRPNHANLKEVKRCTTY